MVKDPAFVIVCSVDVNLGAACAVLLTISKSPVHKLKRKRTMSPTAYTDGLEAEFVVGNTNTGASTVNVATLGVVDIAATTSPGTLTVGDIVRMRFNLGTGDFDIVNNTAQAVPTFTSTEQTITNAGSLTIAHGLGSRPTRIWAHLVNQTAELNYSIGDRLIVSPSQSSSSAVDSRGLSIVPDATNLNIRFGSAELFVLNKTTGAGAAITNVNWKLVLEAKI